MPVLRFNDKIFLLLCLSLVKPAQVSEWGNKLSNSIIDFAATQFYRPHTHTLSHAHTYPLSHTKTHTHKHTHVQLDTLNHSPIHIRSAHTHTHTQTHTRTHTHTHHTLGRLSSAIQCKLPSFRLLFLALIQVAGSLVGFNFRQSKF